MLRGCQLSLMPFETLWQNMPSCQPSRLDQKQRCQMDITRDKRNIKPILLAWHIFQLRIKTRPNIQTFHELKSYFGLH